MRENACGDLCGFFRRLRGALEFEPSKDRKPAAGKTKNSRLSSIILLFAAALFSTATAGADDTPLLEIEIGYIKKTVARLPPISPLAQPPDDGGLAGAKLGIADNNTTGAFLRHRYVLRATAFAVDGEVRPPPGRIFIADLSAADLSAVAADSPDSLFFNVRAADDELRGRRCAANIFHIAPSRAMKADALAQYLVWKRWDKWLVVRGETEDDGAWFDALARAADKFGAEIVDVRSYAYEATARRSDSGHMQIQKQIPALTQGADEHDVLVVADESNVFAEYLPYRAWSPRPVAGSAGLIAAAWHPASEQWGGTQLQRRFFKSFGRRMTAVDYNSWLAARAIGEAATRIGESDPAMIAEYLRGADFSVAGFKGQALTFREWNRQLRQPIFVVQPRLVVSVSPQPGFLHERTPLDSLGADRPQSECRF